MKLVSIHVAAQPGGRMIARRSVRAVAGRGLEGDRYHEGRGTYSATPGNGRQVTLIEIEALEALQRECGVRLAPGNARRNLVTRGVPLNHLVGRDFRIGPVRFRGLRLCEPCARLQKVSGAKVLPGLLHRGGLRAEIVAGGVLRPGQELKPLRQEKTR